MAFAFSPTFLIFHPGVTCCNVYIRLTLGDMERLRLAKELRMQPNAETMWQFTWTRFTYTTGVMGEGMLTMRASAATLPEKNLAHFIGSTQLTSRINTSAEYLFWTGWIDAGDFYSAIHLIAWNAPFIT